MTFIRFAALVFVAVFLNLPAVNAQDHSSHGAVHAPVTTSKPWEKEAAQTMKAMHANMARPYTGDADADFIRGMIPHHQGAVEMARTVLKHGDDEQAKNLARQIIVAQKSEIAWMRKWLRERQIPETGAYSFNR